MKEDGYETLLKEFIEEEEARGRKYQGIIGLKNRVPKFFRYLEEQNLPLLPAGLNEAQGYQGWLIETGRADGGNYSNRTVAAYLVAVTAFYEFLLHRGLTESNPFKEIRRVRSEKKLPGNILREKEMGQLLEELSRFGDESSLKRKVRKYKAHVTAELLYASGMRITEASMLAVCDIDFEAGLVRVREGKGGTPRVCYLNEYSREVLRLYIKRLRPLIRTAWHREEDRLFYTGWQQFGKVMNEVLHETACECELEKITCHGFRHAVGYHLLRAGCSIRWIQEILGHRRLRNTEIYTKVDKEDLKSVLDTCHPRRWGSAG